MSRNNQKTYQVLIESIKNLVTRFNPSQQKVRHANKVKFHWILGQFLVEYEEYQEAINRNVGRRIIKSLQDIPIRWVSLDMLMYAKQFHNRFSNPDLIDLKLSWTHYQILTRISKDEKRFFYLEECQLNQWTTRELARQIRSGVYERNMESSHPPFKEPYVLEFLDLKPSSRLKEQALEEALIDKLQAFLLELGRGFAFVDRQKYIRTVSGKHFFIDLVFYHFILKAFILIDLKIGALTHQDIGQMDMYVRLYEDLWRKPTDGPTIGLILCSQKDQTIVQYSMLQENKQLFASRYQLYLPTEEELKNRFRQNWDL